MGYTDALAEQHRIARFWRSPEAQPALSEQLSGITEAQLDMLTSAVAEGFGQRVAGADPIWVTTDACVAIQSAASTLPPSMLTPELIPAPAAFVMFERPMELTNATQRIQSVAWIHQTAQQMAVTPFKSGGLLSGLHGVGGAVDLDY